MLEETCFGKRKQKEPADALTVWRCIDVKRFFSSSKVELVLYDDVNYDQLIFYLNFFMLDAFLIFCYKFFV